MGKAVLGAQVFAGEFGAEVAVALAHELQRALAHSIVNLAVAALAPAVGDQARIALLARTFAQLLDLALRQTQFVRRLRLLELPLKHLAHHRQSRRFLRAH